MDHRNRENDPSRSCQALGHHNYADGEEIVREGQECSCFYVILSGKVRIIKRGKLIRLLEDQDVHAVHSQGHEQVEDRLIQP
jgi:CRP-like cAMP-binding protein